MTFFISLLSGAIGANAASGIWSRYALSGMFNTAIGLVAGTGIWTLLQRFEMFAPSLRAFLLIVMAGVTTGAVFSLVFGSLQRILYDTGN